MIEDTGASTGRSTWGGSVPANQRELLRYELPGHEDVGAPVELDPDDSDADSRCRANASHTRRAVDRAFDGNVTSDSISSGAMPCPSVRMVTVGAVRSGNTSIGICRAVQPPAARSSAERPITIQWWSIDHCTMRFMTTPCAERAETLPWTAFSGALAAEAS